LWDHSSIPPMTGDTRSGGGRKGKHSSRTTRTLPARYRLAMAAGEVGSCLRPGVLPRKQCRSNSVVSADIYCQNVGVALIIATLSQYIPIALNTPVGAFQIPGWKRRRTCLTTLADPLHIRYRSEHPAHSLRHTSNTC